MKEKLEVMAGPLTVNAPSEAQSALHRDDDGCCCCHESVDSTSFGGGQCVGSNPQHLRRDMNMSMAWA
jgi:hypothetical protein